MTSSKTPPLPRPIRVGPPGLVGITGGIGSGKSYVCRIFKALGVPVYDSDKAARRLMTGHPALRDQLVDVYGKGVLQGTRLNKSILGRALETRAGAEQLNALVHPVVGEDFKNWCAERQQHPYVIKESALLFETGVYKTLDAIVAVAADEQTRISRAVNGVSGRSEKQVRSLMQLQWDEEKRMRAADYTLLNDGTAAILPQVLKLHFHTLPPLFPSP